MYRDVPLSLHIVPNQVGCDGRNQLLLSHPIIARPSFILVIIKRAPSIPTPVRHMRQRRWKPTSSYLSVCVHVKQNTNGDQRGNIYLPYTGRTENFGWRHRRTVSVWCFSRRVRETCGWCESSPGGMVSSMNGNNVISHNNNYYPSKVCKSSGNYSITQKLHRLRWP